MSRTWDNEQKIQNKKIDGEGNVVGNISTTLNTHINTAEKETCRINIEKKTDSDSNCYIVYFLMFQISII